MTASVFGSAETSRMLKTVGTFAAVLFLVREPFSGLIQYMLDINGLSLAWFTPDIVGGICFGLLVISDIMVGSGKYIIICVLLLYYCSLGYVVSESVQSVIVGIKALLPFFSGVLLRPEVFTKRLVYSLLCLLLLAACAGVYVSLAITLPWANLSLDAGFGVKQVTKLSWSDGGVRGYGFASDAHSCASGIMFLWIAMGVGSRSKLYYLLGAVAAISIYFSTSKTVLFCFATLWVLRLLHDLESRDTRILADYLVKAIVLLSGITPILVIIFSMVVDKESLPRNFMGLWDRGGRVYLEPFEFMSDYFSFGWASGFGLGGIGFPLLKSDYVGYAAIVDNFSLWGYYTFGMPFVAALFWLVVVTASQPDFDRRVVFCVVFLLGQFILGWASPLFMLFLGYSVTNWFGIKPTTRVQTSYGLSRQPQL